MRFLFVSSIHEIDGNKIRGNVNFSAQEPWRRDGAGGSLQISTSVVSEAIGQLVSWRQSVRHSGLQYLRYLLYQNHM